MQRAMMDPPLDAPPNETGSFQGPHVLGNRRLGHLERPRELTNSHLALCQTLKHLTARWIGERGEQPVQLGGLLIYH